MPKKIKVLYISPEVVPFCKTGGLADVSGVLPIELEKAGAKVMVVCPYYRQVREYFEKTETAPGTLFEEATLWLGGRLQRYRILESKLPGSKVQICFFDFPALYDRPELYQEKGQDYCDNFFRFAFFSRASLELARTLEFAPDIVHMHDWQSALAAVYLNTLFTGDPVLGKAFTVLTVHNLAYQGLFEHVYLASGDLGYELFTHELLEFWGSINVLKGGIAYANAITTVSPSYAKEIQTEEYGYGLDGILRHKSGSLTGILNGIDYLVWNPETDPLIPHKFSREDPRGKHKCKAALQKAMGLPASDESFLIGMISRLADQKGFDLVQERFPELMKMDIQLVLLGTGKPEYHAFFEDMARKYPRKFSVKLGFDEGLAHLIEAGSDAFLMPSRYEPCGLNQLYSLRYGTIPIVRATGGLKDTITNASKANIKSGKATGFVFEKYDGGEMMKSIGKAVALYQQDAELWDRLIHNAMSKDYSWGASARKYMKLYASLAG